MWHSSTRLPLEDKPDQDRLILGECRLSPTHQDLTLWLGDQDGKPVSVRAEAVVSDLGEASSVTLRGKRRGTGAESIS